MTDKEITQKIDQHIAALAEHFGAVQVLVSWEDPDAGGTRSCYRGSGNVHARLGMARDYLVGDQQRDQAQEIGRVLARDEDGA